MAKTVLITGITGQDGAYLSSLLSKEGHQIYGLTRSYHENALQKLKAIGVEDKVHIEECDLLDLSNVIQCLEKFRPDELYNLAAQSSVGQSYTRPIGTYQFNLLSVVNLLEAIKLVNKNIKFYQASSSEMYGIEKGQTNSLPITENSVMNPVSPYAISKAAAHWTVKTYREAYGIFACTGILFNHESFFRSDNFFIKKIIQQSLAIKEGKQNLLKVGNLDIKRDFGFAPRYAEAIYSIMQNNTPDDFIVCSGRSIKLRDIVNFIFDELNLPHNLIVEDPTLFRPTDIPDIYGDNSKIKKILNWNYELDFFQVLKWLIEEESLGRPIYL